MLLSVFLPFLLTHDCSECSTVCDFGTRVRKWACVDSIGREVQPSNCRGAYGFPSGTDAYGVESQPCNERALCWDYHWRMGPWSACSAACAPRNQSNAGQFLLPTQTRTVECYDPSHGWAGADSQCYDAGQGSKPADVRACNAAPCASETAKIPDPHGDPPARECTLGLIDRLGNCCDVGSVVSVLPNQRSMLHAGQASCDRVSTSLRL